MEKVKDPVMGPNTGVPDPVLINKEIELNQKLGSIDFNAKVAELYYPQ